ncbi:hypothetical protein DSO57_1015241 [Entomophthora muscae]|uniref:Uncharacterized protein n=1 Tax=Entomophthora muscae TaxID=34485 RepID=A0ACC2SI32_9FUNG|nr:hypothetical protein DSO57_1015241 [Entomophthora muscae]
MKLSIGSTLVYRRYLEQILGKFKWLFTHNNIFRYAGIFFVTAISKDDNELITLEYIHRYVEILDKYFNNVCELDIIFNYQKAYFILDEIITFGHFYNSNRNDALQAIALQETFEDTETLQQVWPDIKNDWISHMDRDIHTSALPTFKVHYAAK